MFKPIGKPRVKICCISSTREAWLSIKYGTSAIGLVSEMPSGPGPIPEQLIAKIVKNLPLFVSSFLLTAKQDPIKIISQHRKCQTNGIQIVDKLKISDYEKLRKALPGIDLMQVIHVIGEKAIDEALFVEPYVDGILLDSGNPNQKIKELGGTGQIHDWNISKIIREKVKVPIVLAGGLNPSNVLEAIKQVQPFAVDVCNGVRTNNKLDEYKLSEFFRAVNSSKHISL